MALAQKPLRTIRPKDAVDVYPHPRPQIGRLERNGLLHKVATGYYVVVPQDRVGRKWRPTIEAATAGIAAAAAGLDRFVLMGLTAARLHGVVPRALAVGIVAAPGRRHDIPLTDRKGRVHFVDRDVTVLDAERMTTELGPCLVTTPEQTVLDLAHRPKLGDAEQEAVAAIRALLPRCDADVLERLAGEQRLGAALDRARALVTP